MKVVINALQYKPNSSGIGVMIRDLFGPYTQITRRSCQVILPHDGPEFPAGAKTDIIRSPWKYRQGLRRMFFQTLQLGRRYCRNAVLLTSDSKTPFFLPHSCVMIPVITDLAVFRMPKTYQMSRVLWWRLQYLYIKKRANHFIAVSDSTKDDIVQILGILPEKITVVPCAYSSNMKPVRDERLLGLLRKKYSIAEHFILYVGNSNPRKNIHRIIQAFDRLKNETQLPHDLVIAGGQGWKFDRDKALSGVSHPENIKFIGFVPDEDMPILYSAADLFVFPTLYEGFGVPVLEAQACGAAVLTGNHSSLPYVAGDAAVYTDVYSVEQICSDMKTILTDPALANALIEKGFENVKRFSWRVSADKLNQVIEDYIENQKNTCMSGKEDLR